MISLCPFCGFRVGRPIEVGITTCEHCSRVFDSSPYHRILSAAWLIRKQNLYNIDAIKGSFESLSECELKILNDLIIEKDYSHDELLKEINKKTCIECS